MAISTHSFLPLHFSPTISNRRLVLYNASFAPCKAPVTRCARRTGKRRYPSEKRKLEEIKKNLLTTEIRNREEGYWRISKLSVPAHKDPGKDFVGFSLPLLEAIAKVLEFPVPAMLPEEAFTILRISFDARKGGAGTWSDGKLVTRIGRNSDSVQAVLRTLVQFGAPPNILVDGKPHLGTDKLVPLLRNFRHYLLDLGVDIKFNTRLDDHVVENNQVKGVVVSNSKNEPGRSSDQEKLLFDAVVLAVGHSARDVYNMLLQNNIEMVPRNFAVGLRIEHPQELINSIQYSELASEVQSGRGRIPVADYKVAKNVGVDESGIENRSCYSFCMCPGGQV